MELLPVCLKVTGLIPGQSTCLGCVFGHWTPINTSSGENLKKKKKKKKQQTK